MLREAAERRSALYLLADLSWRGESRHRRSLRLAQGKPKVAIMAEIDRMIAETHEWRQFHAEQYRRGVRGAQIEAAACAIREAALRDAKRAILADRMEGK